MSEPQTMMKHNPGFLAAEALIASFIARQAEFDELVQIVRNNARASNQHVLVIGGRGMGKTTLVHRVALAVERDPALAQRWYPLIFGEAAHGVGTAGELWLEALHQLATKTGEARWRDAHAQLRREPDERRLHQLALARLLEFAAERGVRLLVVVENLQDILGVQIAKDDAWTLRHTLLNEPRIMLLATATKRFDDIDTPKAATYGMFRVIQLRPLERAECRVLWEQLTGESLDDQRIRPIEIFTNGNPRLLTILASFAKRGAPRELMSDLLGLIDDQSDYFDSKLEALSLEERRAFIALCELWAPSPARAVAEVARFDVNKASMLLGRLVNRGAVEVVRVRGRTQYYRVCERLHSLFLRLRRSSTRDLRAASVIDFITRFYAPEAIALLPFGDDSSHSSRVALALRSEGAERALEVLEGVARDNPESLGDLVDIHRDTLMQLALANPERLHAIASSIPLFEPLAVALAGELGHDLLAPAEVDEVAKDIRIELHRLRGGSTSYEVGVPIFAAAEDAPLAKKPASKKPASKKPASKKPASKKPATKKPRKA